MRNRDILDCIRDLSVPRPLVVVCGGGLGTSTRQYMSLYPKSVHVFEPNQLSFAALRDKYVNNKNITVNKTVVTSYTGTIEFVSRNPTLTSGVYRPTAFMKEINGMKMIGDTASVPCCTLSDYVDLHGLDAIDILEIVTEGSELDVLRGCTTIFHKIGLIRVCVIVAQLYEPAYRLHHIDEILSKDFLLFNFFNSYYDDTGRLFRTDCLYVSKQNSYWRGHG